MAKGAHPISMSPTLWAILLLSACRLPSPVTSFGGGAPAHRCSNLVPMHGVNPQLSQPAPFELLLEPDVYWPGDTVRVTLRSTDSGHFKGFAISARRVADDTEELVGSFVEADATQPAKWYGAGDSPNCVTHRSPADKSEVTVEWKAPAASVGDVAFTTPVVRSFRQFWSNVTSRTLKSGRPQSGTEFPQLHVGEGGAGMSGVCGSEFGCVLTPAACGVDAACDAQLKFAKVANDNSEAVPTVTMEILARGEYAAVGFSDDGKMGNDLTVTCTSSQQFSIQIGYNPPSGRRNEQHRCTPLTDKYIDRVGDRLRCRFTMPAVVRISTYDDLHERLTPTEREFDLRNEHFVFLAHGDNYHGSSTPGKHTELPAVSAKPVSIISLDTVTAYSITGLRKAHGSVMLLAWFCLAPVGTGLALMFRRLFEKQLGGVQLWFHLHRALVASAYALSVVGILLIFAGLDWRWAGTYSTSVTHGVMGLVMLGLATGQIGMGMLRPDKDSPRRWLFKLMHQIVATAVGSLGDTAYITIGFLQTLPGQYRTNHMAASIAWVAYNALFRIFVPILTWRWDQAALQSAARADAEDGVRFRLKILLAVYLLGVAAFGLTVFVSLMIY